MIQRLRRTFVAGFFVIVPLVVSVVAIIWLFQWADGLTSGVFARLGIWAPPGLGILVTMSIVLLVGLLATNVLGRRLLTRTEQLLLHVPLFRTVYAPVKQLISAFSPDSEAGFKRVVFIKDPARGYLLGFLTKEFSVDRGSRPGGAPGRLRADQSPLSWGCGFVSGRSRVVFPQMTVQEGIRVFLTGGMALADHVRTRRAGRRPDQFIGRESPRIVINTSPLIQIYGSHANDPRKDASMNGTAVRPGTAILEILCGFWLLCRRRFRRRCWRRRRSPRLISREGRPTWCCRTSGRSPSSGALTATRCCCRASSISAMGLLFGLVIYAQLKNLPVHASMREVSELIYETCKTYLIQQGKFLLILELFIGAIIAFYFGVLQHFTALKVSVILLFSLIGIAGSYGVAWFGIRVNTFANSRTAFASLRGKPFPCYAIPLKAGMSIGMMLISVELLLMLVILLFVPRDYAGACFIGFAIGESLGAAALRIAGGIFTKIADIGADLMKIVFGIKEDDARNPGVIADCTGDNAGDSVGPVGRRLRDLRCHGCGAGHVHHPRGVRSVRAGSAAGLDLHDAHRDGRRVGRVVSAERSGGARASTRRVDSMNYEAPLTRLVWLTSIVSVAATYAAS